MATKTKEDTKRSEESYFPIKYALFATNFLVWVGGVCLMVIGVWSRLEKAQLNYLTGLPTDPAFFLVSVGVVIFLTSIFGCLGSVKENVVFLKLFCVLMLVVFVLQAVASILAFIFLDQVDAFLLSYVKRAIISYHGNDELRVSIDYIQKRFQCCGSSSYADWEINDYYNCSSSSQLRCGVPLSCCIRRNTVLCGHDVRSEGEQTASARVYTTGCIGVLMSMFKDHLVVIGFVAFTVGLLELVAVLLAHALIRAVTLSKLSDDTTNKYRTWTTRRRPQNYRVYPTPPKYPSSSGRGAEVNLTRL